MNFGSLTSLTWHFVLRIASLLLLQGIFKSKSRFDKIYFNYFHNSSEVAKGLKQESYGLVFGINTFLALFFQTILTLIVADSAGLALSPPDQVIC